MSKPKILLYDIETAPIIAYVWGLWNNDVALNQVKSDWHILAWSAKWLDDPASKTMYQDQRNAKDISDDSKLVKGIWKLLDEADIVVTQNGKKFDEKKLNSRFAINGLPPPSPSRHVDTLQLAKKKFGFTSNRLEYLSEKLCTKYKKLKHKKFPGFELWKQCLAGNTKAWDEMRKYNVHDVLALEELYIKLRPWDNSSVMGTMTADEQPICECGSKDFASNGYNHTASGKYKRYTCKKCRKHYTSKINLLSLEKRKNILKAC